MPTDIYDPTAPKKPANLSINSDLLRQARALKINLSQTLEERLAELLREARRSQWLEENQAALDAYNRHIERHGPFSDGLRQF
ncbi:MAG: type II toxin-antitoxin system CcdA family antitoxin [Pseudomonadota bacterium]